MLQALVIQSIENDVLLEMAALPGGIAQELSPLLQAADLEVYKHFLLTMYHYTRDAEKQLKFARDKCKESELYDYFEEMAREERGHYLLAKRDYEELGGNVEKSVEPRSVEQFRNYWYNLGKENSNEFLGAMYVFENVATRVGRDVIAMMERLNLTKRQSRWLRVHLEADVGHGDEAEKMCQKYLAKNPQAMLRAAQEGAAEWMAVFRYAFSNIS